MQPAMLGDHFLQREFERHGGDLPPIRIVDKGDMIPPIGFPPYEIQKPTEAVKVIDSLDLSMVKRKLCLPPEKEGKGWTREQVEQTEKWYKRFLILHAIYPDLHCVPTKEIDSMWHAHILDTKAYHKDCQKAFGHYVHHFPYFGLRGEEDAKAVKSAFEETCRLFQLHFGEMPVGEAHMMCWNNCGLGN